MNELDRGYWVAGPNNKRYYLTDPKPEDFDIEDIAHILSQINRYGGRSPFPYNVAEHSVHCFDFSRPGDKLACLLHDASEIFIGDICRPLKRMLPEISAIEEKISKCIEQRFNYCSDHLYVKYVDNAVLLAEVEHIFPHADFISRIREVDGIEKASVKIKCWTPKKAKKEFLKRFASWNAKRAS